MRPLRLGIAVALAGLIIAACGGGGGKASTVTTAAGQTASTSATGGAPSQAAVNGALLTISDLPTGFTTTPPSSASTGPKPCGLKDYRSQATARGEVDFQRQESALQVTQVGDTIDALPPGQAKAAVDQVQSSLSSCTDFTTTIDGQPVTFHVSPLSFPRLGDQTLAIYLTAQPQGGVLGGATIAAQFIVIRQGNNVAVLTNVALPAVDSSLTENLARKQATKLAAL